LIDSFKLPGMAAKNALGRRYGLELLIGGLAG
jgi:hypothetical protein